MSLHDPAWLKQLPAICDCLHDYQTEQLARVHANMEAGKRKILVQLPTGGGKSHEIGAIAAAAAQAGLPVLILATRTKLVRQLHERLGVFQVDHGVIAAELPEFARPEALVQVASVDTLVARCVRGGKRGKQPLPKAAVVIFDEAHLALADTRVALLKQYPDAWLYGFTATPARRDGRPLGHLFEVLILGVSMLELIQMDPPRLVPMRIFDIPAVTKKQLAALPKDVNRDYQAGASGKLMCEKKLLGNVYDNWWRITEGKLRTVIFACDKEHGRQLLALFKSEGKAAEMLTDDDSEEVREAVIDRLERGETVVVINCFLLAYGVDIPNIGCIILARLTRSVVMYLQMVGRGTRTCEGKHNCILIDHGRVVEVLGEPTDDFAWSLNAAVNVNEDAEKRNKSDTRRCEACGFRWKPTLPREPCPECGHIREVEPIVEEAADLHERSSALTLDPMHVFFSEALGEYSSRYPDRWQANQNKGRWSAYFTAHEKFGLPKPQVRSLPGWAKKLTPKTPSPETVAFLKAKRQAYAQQQEQLRFTQWNDRNDPDAGGMFG